MSTTVSVFPDSPRATLNDSGDRPFAVVELSQHPAGVDVHLRTVTDADEAISAFTEARRILIDAGVTP